MKAIGHTFAMMICMTGLSSCRSDAAVHEIDPDLNRMLEVPRYDSYESSPFFQDRMAMRTPPAGTVPFKSARAGRKSQDAGQDSDSPVQVDMALLKSGKKHFEEVCAVCHGVLGDGNTVVASHMDRPPPSLHQPRLRALSSSKLHQVIEEGYGFMPGYATHLDEGQRWAVVGYVRALQLSQHAALAKMPSELSREARKELSP